MGAGRRKRLSSQKQRFYYSWHRKRYGLQVNTFLLSPQFPLGNSGQSGCCNVQALDLNHSQKALNCGDPNIESNNLPDKRDTLSSLCWTINKSALCPRGRSYVNIVGKIVQNKAASASAHKTCRNVTKHGKLFQQLHSCDR